MRISELLTLPLVKIGLESETKDGLFQEMVQLFVDAGKLKDREAAIAALFDRESKMSTGIANGLGVPHGKLQEATGLLMAAGVSSKGIEYDALDGEPVYVVLMVFAEIDNPGPHIQALAETARLFSLPGFTVKVRAVKRPEELLALIREEE